MRRILPFFLILLSVLANAGTPGTRTQRLAEKLDRSEPLRSGVWGMLAVNMAGDTLVNINSLRKMVPASNMKLITTGAALLSFGPSHTFGTTIGYSGEMRDSTITGDLYIVGGADPTIGTIFPYLPSPEDAFGRWKALLDAAGIKAVSGMTVGDGSLFQAAQLHPDWGMEDLDSKDGVVPSGLTFRGRMHDELPDGPLCCASHFRDYLIDHGFSAAGPAAEGHLDSLTVLGSVKSPSLRSLVKTANHESDNFISETLIKSMGLKYRDSAEYPDCVKALQDALAPLGLKERSRSMRFADGSGLSRKNYISPDFMVSFLRSMTRMSVFKDYLNSIPQPGKGTLQQRLPDRPVQMKRRIFMKSGSMNGVRCFSGYILSSDGNPSRNLAFSLMTNNVTASSQVVCKLTDMLIASLAEEN